MGGSTADRHTEAMATTPTHALSASRGFAAIDHAPQVKSLTFGAEKAWTTPHGEGR
jgi:hypothetical protein